ncbi:hypothetical protein HAX54_033318 [Datura stramonium]|uniref:Uncharacterized protein n=1 Tax=Datura stramonium TaxID=4076 RepID=A0ABS8SDE5_DATST|nr:hypothetical protein [Datura stramonium]
MVVDSRSQGGELSVHKRDNDMNPSYISYQKHDIPRRLCLYLQEALTCLRYVAVRVAQDSSLSFSANLWNLETLIVKGLGGQDTNRIFAKIPNLQKLRCEVLTCDAFFPAFNNLTKLEMLKFSWGRAGTWATVLNLPPSLKKLTLSNGRIFSLDQVATLPKLVVLKLQQVIIESEEWEVTDEQFLHLKFLKLQDPFFSEWNVSDDAFPCLEHLVLRRLRRLEKIPSRFADMPTLKSIEVMTCKESLVESAKDIKETQVEEMQNSGFKLFIQK